MANSRVSAAEVDEGAGKEGAGVNVVGGGGVGIVRGEEAGSGSTGTKVVSAGFGALGM